MAEPKSNKDDQIKKLYLSTDDKKLMGVCGGLAEYFEIDSTLVRLGWVVMTFITGIIPGVFSYFIVGIIVPPKPAS